MKGIVVFMQSNEGSKSEGMYPYLYTGKGNFIRVYKQGDNPFENRTFKKYDAECVEVEGEEDENEQLIVSKISRVTSEEPESVEEDEEFYPLAPDDELDKEFTLAPEEEEEGKDFAPSADEDNEEYILVPEEEK